MENLENEIINYSKELTSILNIAKTHRVGYMPEVYKTLLLNNIKHDLYLKENNIFYEWSSSVKNEFNNTLDSWANTSSLNLLSNLVESFKTFLTNYTNNINNISSMSYNEKSKCISDKENSINKYITNTLNEYVDVLLKENEYKDVSCQLLSKIVLFINTSKTYLEAKRVTDETNVGKLALILSSVQTLEAASDFKDSASTLNQVLTEIRELHNFFKKLYFNYHAFSYNKKDTNQAEEFKNIENKLTKAKEDKIYYLNILTFTYNKVYNHYFDSITKDAIEVYKACDFLPETLMNSNAVSKILSYFTNKRVDTMKEAINLYFNETKQDEQYNQLVNVMGSKISSLETELSNTKANFSEQARLMEAEYERLREAHNDLVDKHNDLVHDHNDLVDKHNEVIDIAKDIKNSLD